MSRYGENLLFFQSLDKQLGPSRNELMKPNGQDFPQQILLAIVQGCFAFWCWRVIYIGMENGC